MFCPKCGKADQKIDTYCRQCGTFLPDFDKIQQKESPPELHLKANTILSFMTGIVSLTLAIILYSIFWGREDTPVIIYVVAGFLIAMFAWQVQTFWRNLLLKKHFDKRKTLDVETEEMENNSPTLQSMPTNELLSEADFSNVIPTSITEDETKDLKEKVKRST